MNLTVSDAFEIRSNNTWINRSKSTPAPHALFGEFWRQGELAVLFAHHGLGKSTLAMQIAESVARGNKKSARESTRINANKKNSDSLPIRAHSRYSRANSKTPLLDRRGVAALGDGVVDAPNKSNDQPQNEFPFPTTAPPQTVLYLDLEMTAKQVELRYSRDGEDGELLRSHHRFSERLKRVEVRPELLAGRGERPVDEILYDLIEPLVLETKASVLIIDNIGCLRRSAYSTRECVRFMKDLHRLKCLHNLSVLVIAPSQKNRTPRPLSVADMQSLKSIAEHADTVFAIGQSSYDAGERYIKHIRTRNAEIVHSEEHVPVFRLKKIARNFLGFDFQRFAEETALLRTPPRQADRETMQKILELTEQGLTIRAIADQLEISKSTAHRFRTEAQHWHLQTPIEQTTQPSDDAEDNESISDQPESPAALRDIYLNSRHDNTGTIATNNTGRNAGSPPAGGGVDAALGGRGGGSRERAPSLPDGTTDIPTDDSPGSLNLTNSTDPADPLDPTGPPDPILSLPRGVDDFDREIYIEKPGLNNRHYVWYYFDDRGVKTRLERRGYGIFVTKFPDEKRMPP